MTETLIEYDESGQTALTYDVSDEVLERTVGEIVAGNYTLAACTGLSVCPG